MIYLYYKIFIFQNLNMPVNFLRIIWNVLKKFILKVVMALKGELLFSLVHLKQINGMMI